MSKEIKTGKLSPKNSELIIQKHNAKVLEIPDELKSDLSGTKLYELDDGRIAIISVAGGGYLYKDMNEFNAVSRNSTNDESINKEIYPFEQTFPDSVEKLSNELFEFLDIPKVNLNYSLKSLEFLDERISLYSRKNDVDIIRSHLYIMIVAYAYEVTRVAVNGKISMKPLQGFSNIFYPTVIGVNQKEYTPIALIYEGLISDENPYPLTSAIQGELTDPTLIEDLIK